jgi:hypothetical protein
VKTHAPEHAHSNECGIAAVTDRQRVGSLSDTEGVPSMLALASMVF